MKIGVLATMIFSLALGFPLASMGGLAPDNDGDGIPDVLDNCSTLANSGTQSCDTDIDGYGNACDGDFDQNNATNANDFTIFVADFQPPGTDSGVGTDMNCNGSVEGNDFTLFSNDFAPPGEPGPSGLSCAGEAGCM